MRLAGKARVVEVDIVPGGRKSVMGAECAVVKPVDPDVVVLDVPVEVVVHPVVPPLVDHAEGACPRAREVVDVAEGAQDVEQDLVRGDRVHLRLVVVEPVILVDQPVKIVVDPVVRVGVDERVSCCIEKHVPFDDLCHARPDFHRQSARMKDRVGGRNCVDAP